MRVSVRLWPGHSSGGHTCIFGTGGVGARPRNALSPESWQPIAPCLEAGLGQDRPGPLPGHRGHVTATLSPSRHRLFPAAISSPPNQQILPTVRNFPSRRKSKRQSQILTNLEMYEHTAQTIIIIAPNCPVSAMTEGWARSLTSPTKPVWPLACPEPRRG